VVVGVVGVGGVGGDAGVVGVGGFMGVAGVAGVVEFVEAMEVFPRPSRVLPLHAGTVMTNKKDKPKLKKIQLRLYAETIEEAERIAEEQGASVAFILREAAKRGLKKMKGSVR
jgi:hypothetical protein